MRARQGRSLQWTRESSKVEKEITLIHFKTRTRRFTYVVLSCWSSWKSQTLLHECAKGRVALFPLQEIPAWRKPQLRRGESLSSESWLLHGNRHFDGRKHIDFMIKCEKVIFMQKTDPRNHGTCLGYHPSGKKKSCPQKSKQKDSGE